ncbi:MAG TPA: glycosyltransferase family 39 protein [Acidobacteriaceae bacterium]|nr:glycosyltransferase family 39 protein [Acidobacteriaceae bacterium]
MNRKLSVWSVAGALIILQMLLVAIIVHGESLSFDEADHIFAGYMMWHSGDYGLNPEHPPLVKLVATLPLLQKKLWVPPLQQRMFKAEAYLDGRDFMERNDPGHRLLFRMRLAAGVFTLGLSVTVFLTGSEFFGQSAGLLALLLLVFEPNVLANSDLGATDIGGACFLRVTIYCFYRYARQPSVIRLLLTGLAAGLTLSAKHSGILLAPILLGLALAEIACAERGQRKRMAGTLLGGFAAIVVLAVVVLWAFYGFRYAARPAGLVMNPTLSEYAAPLTGMNSWVIGHLANWRLLPESYLMGMTDIHYAAQQYPIFLLGHDYAHGVWWYFPVALSIKTTLGLIGLMVLAAIALISRRLRQRRELAYLVVPGAIYLTAAILSGMNIGTRHVLFLYPLSALLAAAGLTALVQHSRRWIWIGGGLVAFHVVSVLAVFPAEMAYANEAWGGAANTHKYLSDSNVDWAQQLPHVRQWVDAHPGEECWFAYSAYPVLRPQAYGIPCHPLPTAHTGYEILPVDVPETIHGYLLLSADDLEACDWPSDQLNVFERFRWMPMTEQIDHSVFVFHGDFHVPEAAALAAVQKSNILLRENRPTKALVAAQKAVALQPENLLAQMALGDAQAALGDKNSARAAYELALAAAHRLEADAQPLFVPNLERKLHP